MAQRPSFDMNRLSTATKILLGAGILFLIDAFLPWQRVCVPGFGNFPGACASANLWGGSGSFAGVLAGILVILLIVWEGLAAANVNMNLNLGVPASTISAFLAFGVALFALLKFVLVVTNSPGYGAWIGLVLALVIAYGGYMKLQEGRIGLSRPEGGMSPPPPPVAP